MADREPTLAKIRHFGWETLLGAAILMIIFGSALILRATDPDRKGPVLQDSYCTPGLLDESRKPQEETLPEATSARQNQEDDMFGGTAEPARSERQAERCSRNYLFGTDSGGRDIFYYIMTTSTAYLLPSLIVIAISMLVGSFFGVMAGYYDSTVAGHAASMVANSISVYPPLLFVILLTRILNNPPIEIIAVVFALTEAARLGFTVMNKIQVLREEEFIAAAKEMGLSDWRIITKHILWYNCREVLIVHGIFSISSFIMIELYLGYLNAGNFGAWGAIIGPGARDFSNHWWLLILPCVVVVATVFAFYLIGDGMVKYFASQTGTTAEQDLRG